MKKRRLLPVLLALLIAQRAFGEPPLTGPETEKRFPPLQVADGFRATLFACDPLIEYPSVLSLGPRPGSMFLAHDYLTGLGIDIVRRDEVRLVEDTDGDGYADKSTVYAAEFQSIQGLAFHDGTVYVMHAPLLTALRDTDGDGVADERRDLLRGLGLPPEENPPRLHCANGVVMGHDGWLYLALGDHGCDVQRPEGDCLVFEGGGILRCRADGRDLHVLSSGLRNIYDVALDEQLNVFVRDNENDGGDYKIRVCYCFFGSDHGYPYLYYERPEEALPPLADLGLGSSAGGVCYLETAFPEPYRGTLFFCEWGRSLVSYQREQHNSWFAPLQQFEFASGAAGDPYGFKPVDVIVDWDGSLLVADWADGQRPKRGRGRVYRLQPSGDGMPPVATRFASGPDHSLTSVSPEQWLVQLESGSYHARVQAQARLLALGPNAWNLIRPRMLPSESATLGRLGQLHGVWIAALSLGRDATDDLFELARDAEPDVALQAVRALADLYDPVLNQHRLDNMVAPQLSQRLAEIAQSRDDPRFRREAVIALGRWQWAGAPEWMASQLHQPDAAMQHAAQQTLRRCGNWAALVDLLDLADEHPIRAVALRAVADQYQPQVVDGLLARLATGNDPLRQRHYADALTRVYQRPSAWVYWGYRPAPRPANTVVWERTEAIAAALDQVLAGADRETRLATLRRMQREQVPVRPATLQQWLQQERDAACVAAALESLRTMQADQARDVVTGIVSDRVHDAAHRLAAIQVLVAHDQQGSAARCHELAQKVEEGAVLAELLRHVGRHTNLDDVSLLLRHTHAGDASVRAAAVAALGQLKRAAAREPVLRLLDDESREVQTAAATAAGQLALVDARDGLLRAAADEHVALRSAALDALRTINERRAVDSAVRGLADAESLSASLAYLEQFGSGQQREPVLQAAQRHRNMDVLIAAVRTLNAWRGSVPPNSPDVFELQQAADALQGRAGVLVRWQLAGPWTASAAAAAAQELADAQGVSAEPSKSTVMWRTQFATGIDAQVQCATSPGGDADSHNWLAQSSFATDSATRVQFLTSSNAALRIWLNGKLVHQRAAGEFLPDSDRFESELEIGRHRLLLELSGAESPRFHVRFRAIGTSAEHDRLIELALGNTGNAARGRDVFLQSDKSQCVKCHRLGDEGGRVGPELTGVGRRFARIHLIESILQPGRTVGPGFQAYVAALQDGRVVSGIRVAETEDLITLGDNQGQLQQIPKSEIDDFKVQPGSIMPDGLEKRLSQQEFIDLIAFLSSLRDG